MPRPHQSHAVNNILKQTNMPQIPAGSTPQNMRNDPRRNRYADSSRERDNTRAQSTDKQNNLPHVRSPTNGTYRPAPINN